MKIVHRLILLALGTLLSLPLPAQMSAPSAQPAKVRGIPDIPAKALWEDEFGMVWIGTEDGLVRYDGLSAEIFRPEPGNPRSIYSNDIGAITGDGDGHLYIICNASLCRYDMRSESFELLRKENVQAISYRDGLYAAVDNGIFRLSDDDKWIEIVRIPDEAGQITVLLPTGDNQLVVGTDRRIRCVDQRGKMLWEQDRIWVIGLYEDSRHNIWAGTMSSGTLMRSRSGEWTRLRRESVEDGLSSNCVRSVCEDADGNYWLGTLYGLDLYQPESRTIRRMLQGEGSERLSVNGLQFDSDGTLWIAAREGLRISRLDQNIYTFHDPVFFDERLTTVRDFVQDGEYLYCATADLGIIRYDLREHTATRFPSQGRGFAASSTLCLYLEEGSHGCWIGTMMEGLYRIDLQTEDTRAWRTDPDDPASLPSNIVRDIQPYRDKLVIATSAGAVLMDPEKNTFERISTSPRVVGEDVHCILVDREGTCWIAVGNGLVRHDLSTGEEKEYFFDDNSLLGTSRIQTAFLDHSGRAWFGTSGSGLFRYDAGTDGFTAFTRRNSQLANDYIWRMTESQSGYLLLAHNEGFSRMDTERESFINYGPQDGFPVSNLSYSALYVNPAGEVFVSGYRKVVSFREEMLTSRKAPGNIYFSDLEVGHQKLSPGDDSGILKSSLLYQDRIRLRGNKTVFSVVTVAPGRPNRGNLEYRLEGFNKEWIRGRLGDRITYTSLRPGRYTLEARCVSPETGRVTANRSLAIRILPHWYWSLPARILYLVLLGLAAWGLLRAYTARINFRNTLAQEQREKEQIRELNQSKMQFFTYISHEIRTPVTLIQSQVDTLLGKNNVPPFIYNKVLSINRNLGKIHSLLGELLDFKKHEQGSVIQVRFREQDLLPVLQRTSLVFKEFAANQRKRFEFRNDCGNGIPLWFDAEQLDKVFYNLLSNAFKHTPEEGSVTLGVSEDEDHVTVTVADTGEGIAPEHLGSIFEPFYQVPDSASAQKGTGLGLSITQGIVKAHGGEIRCSSALNVGTTFTVTLPKGDAHIPAGQKDETPLPETETKQSLAPLESAYTDTIKKARGEDVQPSILIVEDNGELREYLATLFAPIYSVTTACDGADAWEKLEHHVPDLILTDLMMPNLDGNELCIKVKNSFYTSHVPVVILTAKTAEESVLESLRNSADDYIVKPFNAKVLVAKCNNLVNTRIGLQRSFEHSADSPERLATNEIDRAFIEKAIRVVTENLTNPDFDVNQFASEMALGRTRLFGKLKGVTGQTPNKFITTVRLRYAREKLSDPEDFSVGQVSDMAGFSSPSYFIRAFKSVYGLTPAAFKEESRKL